LPGAGWLEEFIHNPREYETDETSDEQKPSSELALPEKSDDTIN
jgi:hypothetical protein